MDQAARLIVFQSQTKNVRAMRTAMKHAHRNVNASLRARDSSSVSTYTKIYAVIFCAWAEANFSKLIHTPYGFDLDEIKQIKKVHKDNGIASGWKKAVELGMRHLDAKRGSFTPNAKQLMFRLIDTHVFDPSLLRNKLAHGQWSVALNRENDAINVELTSKIADLDVVRLAAWCRTHELVAGQVETLIESPKKAFMRDWHQAVAALEAEINAAEAQTLGEHVKRLQAKDARTGARAKRADQVV